MVNFAGVIRITLAGEYDDDKDTLEKLSDDPWRYTFKDNELHLRGEALTVLKSQYNWGDQMSEHMDGSDTKTPQDSPRSSSSDDDSDSYSYSSGGGGGGGGGSSGAFGTGSGRFSKCPMCKGSGKAKTTSRNCSSCKGTGKKEMNY